MKVIVILGPTGVGKSRLAIKLAERINGEIVNGDSMQVYQEMKIGTAKPNEQQMQRVKHHMFNVTSVKLNYSVADYKAQATPIIEEIAQRKKVPIIVGGTGLYLRALLYDYEFEAIDGRSNDQEFEQFTNQELWHMLNNVDPETGSKIHPNNRKRLIRALEIYNKSGNKKSDLEAKQSKTLKYQALVVGLTMDRTLLYNLINQRVDQMFELGLVDEVKSIIKVAAKNSTALQAIGYKEFVPYFEGHVTLEEVKAKIKQNTRKYAKRQYTFFKHQFEAQWFDVNIESTDKVISDLISLLK